MRLVLLSGHFAIDTDFIQIFPSMDLELISRSKKVGFFIPTPVFLYLPPTSIRVEVISIFNRYLCN